MKTVSPFFLTLALFIGAVLPARASETVEIPQEELARESVLPRFDRPDNVKNRNVVTSHKVEFGVYYGLNFTEPIYNQSKIGFNAGYHLSEDSAIMVNFAQWMSGRNSLYVPNIQAQAPQTDYSRVPDLKDSIWVHYEVTAYYGKISLTKNGVMNTTLYPIFGAGATQYTNKVYPGIDVGVGQKFYFTKTIALRIDFKFQYQQSPNPFVGSALQVSQPAPSSGAFSDQWTLGNILDAGVSFLF